METHETEVRKQTLKLVQSYLTLISQQRLDEWIELWAEDGICEFPYAIEGRPQRLQGKAAIYAYNLAAYSGKISMDSISEMRVHPMLDPEAAAVEVAINGRVLTTGCPYNQRYVAFVEVKSGKVWRYREYWNPLISIEAFGGFDAWLTNASTAQGAEAP